jgi:hypothetical protein
MLSQKSMKRFNAPCSKNPRRNNQVKKSLFAVMFVAVFTFAAMAAEPSLTLDKKGTQSHSGYTPTWGLPHTPGSIIFYGGDTNPNDPNAQGFANENTLLVPTSYTYAAVKAPAKVTVGAIFNNTVSTIGDIFDPATGTYDVRTGVSEGNGGKDLTSGSGAQTAVATGRDPFGLPEYTLTVKFAKPLTATAGTTYWSTEVPQCTNSSDSNCDSAEYFVDNTTQETNGVNAKDQVAGQLYLNSSYFGFTWANWCDSSLGQDSEQCARESFGFTN